MSWVEQEMKSRKPAEMTGERAHVLDLVKKECLPVIAREADGGDKAFDPVKMQPVRSPGLFEAEFFVSGDDIGFHFWPWGYRQAEKGGASRPKFRGDFLTHLKTAMENVFEKEKLAWHDDREQMGSWCVFAKGFGNAQFRRLLAVRAVTTVHKLMGGS